MAALDRTPLMAAAAPVKIVVHELTPARWRDVETLFGPRGAVGGCWCMWWRLQKGESWGQMKGASNKRRFKKLVTTKAAHGALAYAEGKPVGWVSFDRRTDFSRLDRAPSFTCDDADRVWSVPCFFIKPGFRGQGVASALLQFAMKVIKKRGGKIAEGYPVKTSAGGPTPAAFAWTGTDRMFSACGFTPATRKRTGKIRMRKKLGAGQS